MSMKGMTPWLAGAVGLALAGCSFVRVSARGDIDTSNSHVVVFPMMLFDGQKLKPANTSYSNPSADGQFQKMWVAAVGEEHTTIVSKPVLDAIPLAYDAMNAMIGKMDAASVVESPTGITKLLAQISTKVDGSALAIALVFEDEQEYAVSKRVHVNMGLFDTKRMAWKWITRHEYSVGFFSAQLPYRTVVANLVSESHEALVRRNGGVLR